MRLMFLEKKNILKGNLIFRKQAQNCIFSESNFKNIFLRKQFGKCVSNFFIIWESNFEKLFFHEAILKNNAFFMGAGFKKYFLEIYIFQEAI